MDMQTVFFVNWRDDKIYKMMVSDHDIHLIHLLMDEEVIDNEWVMFTIDDIKAI